MGRKIDRKTVFLITWICRIVFGVTFIFSGFTKGVDPWGTVYKLESYAASLSIDVWSNLINAGAFLLGAAEFLLGVMILFGCFRRSSAIASFAVMVFMLPFTLWVAIKNPVADCGCFGDAFIISNWATFFKNILLSAVSVWLLIYNKRSRCLITPAFQWISLVVTLMFIIYVESYGFLSQPMLDFRHYKVGEKLFGQNDREDSEIFEFVYRKGNEEIVVGVNDSIPSEEEGWRFVERRELIRENGNDEYEGDEKTFRIWDRNGEDDISEEVVDDSGKTFLVMIPSLQRVSPATTWKLNSLHSWAESHNIGMAAVVSGSSDDINVWEDLSMASYPIYTADETAIKEVVRGNPGIVYLEDGTVVWKSTLNAIEIDDFQLLKDSTDAKSFVPDAIRLLRNISYFYMIVMTLLVAISYLPLIKKIYNRNKIN